MVEVTPEGKVHIILTRIVDPQEAMRLSAEIFETAYAEWKRAHNVES